MNARLEQQEKQFWARDEKLSSLISLFERLPQENRQHRNGFGIRQITSNFFGKLRLWKFGSRFGGQCFHSCVMRRKRPFAVIRL